MRFYTGEKLMDFRHATEALMKDITMLADIELILVSERTRPYLDQIELRNVSHIAVLPEDCRLINSNGKYQLNKEQLAAPIFLLIDGLITCSPDVTPEGILKSVKGGMINGKLFSSEGQLAALNQCGVIVNGVAQTYPDGYTVREEKGLLTLAEAENARTCLFLPHPTHVENGVLQALAEKKLYLSGKNKLICDSDDSDYVADVWQGSGSVVVLAKHTKYVSGSKVFRGPDTCILSGDFYLDGDLTLRETVAPAHIAKWNRIWLTGSLLAPTALMPQLLDKLQNEPELIPYEGVLIRYGGKDDLDEDGLEALPDQLSIVVDGILLIDKKVSPAALSKKIILLLNNGIVRLSSAQKAALLPALLDNGQTIIHEKKKD